MRFLTGRELPHNSSVEESEYVTLASLQEDKSEYISLSLVLACIFHIIAMVLTPIFIIMAIYAISVGDVAMPPSELVCQCVGLAGQ